MKAKLLKVKKGKEAKWKAWCLMLMEDLRQDAKRSLRQEKLEFEGSMSFIINGEMYVLGFYEGKGLPADMSKRINVIHKNMKVECLEFIQDVEMDYFLKAK